MMRARNSKKYNPKKYKVNAKTRKRAASNVDLQQVRKKRGTIENEHGESSAGSLASNTRSQKSISVSGECLLNS